jgi:hypothetical protein
VSRDDIVIDGIIIIVLLIIGFGGLFVRFYIEPPGFLPPSQCELRYEEQNRGCSGWSCPANMCFFFDSTEWAWWNFMWIFHVPILGGAIIAIPQYVLRVIKFRRSKSSSPPSPQI